MINTDTDFLSLHVFKISVHEERGRPLWGCGIKKGPWWGGDECPPRTLITILTPEEHSPPENAVFTAPFRVPSLKPVIKKNTIEKK